MDILINVLLVIHVIVALLIILVVLMQRPKNEGLGAAFGGGMTDQMFGAQTTNVLQTFTRWMGGLFFILSLTLAALFARQVTGGKTEAYKTLEASAVPVPAASPASSPAAAFPLNDDIAPTSAPDASPGVSPATPSASAPAATAEPAAAAPDPTMDTLESTATTPAPAPAEE